MDGEAKYPPRCLIAADVATCLELGDFVFVGLLYVIHRHVTAFVDVFADILDGFHAVAGLYVDMCIESPGQKRVEGYNPPVVNGYGCVSASRSDRLFSSMATILGLPTSVKWIAIMSCLCVFEELFWKVF